MDYGQFCPVAKAAEVLGEKWTILVLRELLYGTRRFNEIQRAVGGISPTMLNKRLKELEAHGLLTKDDSEYLLTPAGQDLAPLLRQYAVWGMRWARGELNDQELDVELLMSDIRRRIKTEHLPADDCIIQVHISDLEDKADWWLVVDDRKVELVTTVPKGTVDLLITAELKALIEVWLGDMRLHTALARRQVSLQGRPMLIRVIEQWLPLASYANIRRAASSQ